MQFEYNGRLNDLINLELRGFQKEKVYRINSRLDYSEISLGKLDKEIDINRLNITFENGGLENLRDEFRGQEFFLSI